MSSGGKNTLQCKPKVLTVPVSEASVVIGDGYEVIAARRLPTG